MSMSKKVIVLCCGSMGAALATHLYAQTVHLLDTVDHRTLSGYSYNESFSDYVNFSAFEPLEESYQFLYDYIDHNFPEGNSIGKGFEMSSLISRLPRDCLIYSIRGENLISEI